MDGFELVKPTSVYREQALEYIREFRLHNSPINGSGGLDRFEDYDQWLEKIRHDEEYHSPKNGWVPATTLFFVRKSDNRIIGMTNIRHRMNDHILHISGHIGYSIRPSERQRGYGTHLLYLALAECAKMGIDRVLVSCEKSNIGSEKVIINNRGIFENEQVDSTTGKTFKRFWIDVKKAIS